MEHSAVLSTFISLPVIIKTFVLSSFEWLFYTCFTILNVHLLEYLFGTYLVRYGPGVIKLEFILKLKIKRNDWLLVDMCLQIANHCDLF